MDKFKIISNFVKNNCLEINTSITANTSLFRSGIMDSLSFLKLVIILNKSFGIKLNNHDLNINKFDTINSIVKLIEQKEKN